MLGSNAVGSDRQESNGKVRSAPAIRRRAWVEGQRPAVSGDIGDMAVPEDDAVHLLKLAERTLHGALSSADMTMGQADSAARQVEIPGQPQFGCHWLWVIVACHSHDRGDPAQFIQHRPCDQIAGVQNQINPVEMFKNLHRQLAGPTGDVGICNDPDSHDDHLMP